MTGFLSLPLELRERIYEFALPADGFVTVANPFPFPEEQHIRNMALINEQIREELCGVVKRKCGFRIAIQPPGTSHRLDRLNLDYLRCLKLDEAKSLEIYIDYNWSELDAHHYQQEHIDGRYGRVIGGLCTKLYWVLPIIGRFPSLPPLTIRFRDEPMPSTGASSFGDPFWTRSCLSESHEYRSRTICKDRPCTIMGRAKYFTFFGRILFCLQEHDDLAGKFRSVHVVPLRCISAREESENWGLDPYDSSLERPVKTAFDNQDRAELRGKYGDYYSQHIFGKDALHRDGLFEMWRLIKIAEERLTDGNFR